MGVVIYSAKFDACTSSSFREVKADIQTDRIALYSIDIVLFNMVKKGVNKKPEHHGQYLISFLLCGFMEKKLKDEIPSSC